MLWKCHLWWILICVSSGLFRVKKAWTVQSKTLHYNVKADAEILTSDHWDAAFSQSYWWEFLSWNILTSHLRVFKVHKKKKNMADRDKLMFLWQCAYNWTLSRMFKQNRGKNRHYTLLFTTLICKYIQMFCSSACTITKYYSMSTVLSWSKMFKLSGTQHKPR